MTKDKHTLYPFAVVAHGERAMFACGMHSPKGLRIFLSQSDDGLVFYNRYEAYIFSENGRELHLPDCDSIISFFYYQKEHFLIYSRTVSGKKSRMVAQSSDGINFKTLGKVDGLPEIHAVVSNHKYKKNYLAYYAEKQSLQVAASDNALDWHATGELLPPRNGYFDDGAKLSVVGTMSVEKGLLVLYEAETKSKNKSSLKIKIGAALFSLGKPYHPIWRSEEPIFEETLDKKKHPQKFLGAVLIGNSLHVYWASAGNEFFVKTISLSTFGSVLTKSKKQLKRHHGNPILEPIADNHWEYNATLNPAAIRLKDRTHLIYRAIGSDGTSTLGYASSENGIIYNERLSHPIYFDPKLKSVSGKNLRYSPVMYQSGGSWGGYEDPRMVEIDGHIYVTFNMFENWVLRVAFISISRNDFLKKRFHKWEGPYILSHGDRDKNWVLFPEKMDGKFAVLHSIIGESEDRVCIEYIDDLKKLSKRKFSSLDPQKVPDRRIAWHTHVRSAGPPPLRTDRGWLLFYHANDQEKHKYKVGAMVLDLENPEKIIARAEFCVLEPDLSYENDGKPGIVYAAGATIQDGKVYLYYGGADRVVCVASTDLEELLEDILSEKSSTQNKSQNKRSTKLWL